MAANLYMQENTVTWSRFNIMIAANGAIVAATGVAASASTPLLLLAFSLPLGGLILCYIWWNMTKRGFAYHGVWRDAAYELERVHFRSAACTLWYADQLRHGGNVTITIKGEGADKGQQRLHKAPRGRAQTYAGAVIILFCIVYVFAFAQVVMRFLGSSAH